MVYAMNLYDIIDQEMYGEYVRKTMEFLPTINAGSVAAGFRPCKEICGQTRSHFIVAKFDSIADFDAMIEWQEKHDVKKLREESTTNYIWTLYESWDMSDLFDTSNK